MKINQISQVNASANVYARKNYAQNQPHNNNMNSISFQGEGSKIFDKIGDVAIGAFMGIFAFMDKITPSSEPKDEDPLGGNGIDDSFDPYGMRNTV